MEEERRLCYVGVTRAREKLYLSYAQKRMLFGSINYAAPSPFLTEMGDALPINRSQPRQAFRQSAEQAERRTYTPPKVTTSMAVKLTKPEPPKAPTKKFDGAVGDRVNHKEFGKGTIAGISGSGSAMIVEIKFDNGMSKKLAAAFAPLDKLDA
jgi:DNA helicase-2/ATP-dependent DNA helicase PcrA